MQTKMIAVQENKNTAEEIKPVLGSRWAQWRLARPLAREDLASTIPHSISPPKNERKSIQQSPNVSVTVGDPMKSNTQQPMSYEEMNLMEPQTITVVFYRDPLEIPVRKLGVRLGQCASGSGILIEELLQSGGDFILPPDIAIRPGDELEAINGVSCNTLLPDQVTEMLHVATGLVTLRFNKVIGVVCQPEFTIQESIVLQPARYPPEDFELGVEFTSSSRNNQDDGILRIQSIDERKNSWLANSCLAEGQIVLSINGNPSHQLPASDAEIFLRTRQCTGPSLTIKTCSHASDARCFRTKFRRAAVAVGGSAMVGAGAVIMATPLHPLGHAMALGGMGVLGSEFEGPRMALEKARTSLHLWRNNTKEIAELTTAFSTSSSSSSTSKETPTALNEAKLPSKGDVSRSIFGWRNTSVY